MGYSPLRHVEVNHQVSQLQQPALFFSSIKRVKVNY